MKNIIHHVHSKPEHIRHLVALGCTVVVASIVLGFWFHSFQNTTYALLNPGQVQDQSVAAAPTADSSQSLFSQISTAFASMKAQIASLFGGSAQVQTQSDVQQQPPGPVYPLPVSNNK